MIDIQRYDSSDYDAELPPMEDGDYVLYFDHIVAMAEAVDEALKDAHQRYEEAVVREINAAEQRGYERGWNDGAAAMA